MELRGRMHLGERQGLRGKTSGVHSGNCVCYTSLDRLIWERSKRSDCGCSFRVDQAVWILFPWNRETIDIWEEEVAKRDLCSQQAWNQILLVSYFPNSFTWLVLSFRCGPRETLSRCLYSQSSTNLKLALLFLFCRWVSQLLKLIPSLDGIVTSGVPDPHSCVKLVDGLKTLAWWFRDWRVILREVGFDKVKDKKSSWKK